MDIAFVDNFQFAQFSFTKFSIVIFWPPKIWTERKLLMCIDIKISMISFYSKSYDGQI